VLGRSATVKKKVRIMERLMHHVRMLVFRSHECECYLSISHLQTA